MVSLSALELELPCLKWGLRKTAVHGPRCPSCQRTTSWTVSSIWNSRLIRKAEVMVDLSQFLPFSDSTQRLRNARCKDARSTTVKMLIKVSLRVQCPYDKCLHVQTIHYGQRALNLPTSLGFARSRQVEKRIGILNYSLFMRVNLNSLNSVNTSLQYT